MIIQIKKRRIMFFDFLKKVLHKKVYKFKKLKQRKQKR